MGRIIVSESDSLTIIVVSMVEDMDMELEQ